MPRERAKSAVFSVAVNEARGTAGAWRQLGTCMSNCNSGSFSAWVIDGNIAVAAADDDDDGDGDGRFTGLVSSIVIILAGHVPHNFSHAVGNARMLPVRCAFQICICLALKLYAACCNCGMCACVAHRGRERQREIMCYKLIKKIKIFYF